MQPESDALLCQYHYDAQDRLVASTPLAQARIQRFYQQNRMTTEIQGAVQWSVLQHGEQPLAQQKRQDGSVENHLLATDLQRSVLNVLDAGQPDSLAYTPYGHRPLGNRSLSLLGFNGERRDPLTGWYLLGNGYRAFNPVLMRFNSPDRSSFSPFGKGGLNAYAYCSGDPVNYDDRTGRMRSIKALLGIKKNLNESKPVIPPPSQPPPPPSNMKNIKSLGNGYTFESTYKGRSRINIVGHGSEKYPGRIKINGELWGAEDIIRNVDLKPFDNIRLLACYTDELGASLAFKTGKPVKAYKGPLHITHGPSTMMEIFRQENTSHLPNMGKYNGEFKITKQNLANPDTEKEKFLNFNYQSVSFTP